jgi:hypothetical protein
MRLRSGIVWRRPILDLNHKMGSRARAADEHLARIKRIQGLEAIIDVAFQKLVLAAVTNTGAAAEVREDPLIFGKFDSF